MDEKMDRLDALIEKSWMYRALKMETEIEDLRDEIKGFRQAQRQANEVLFDKLHDISTMMDQMARRQVGVGVSPAPYEKTATLTYEQINKVIKELSGGNTHFRPGDTVRLDVNVT